jgi:exodeoxyribonuclease VII small subunit
MTKAIDYKALRAELDEVLAKLDDESLDVEEMTRLYERGMEIAQQLEEYLKTAENKVHKIKQSFSEESQ